MNISDLKATKGQADLCNEGFDLDARKTNFPNYLFSFWFPRRSGFRIRKWCGINLEGAQEDAARWVLPRVIIVQRNLQSNFPLTFLCNRKTRAYGDV